MHRSDESREVRGNQLLQALPADVLERLLPHLEQVLLPPGEILYNFNDDITHVYFPNQSTVVSTLSTTDERITVEVGLTGNEGFVGWSGLMGLTTTPHQYLVQVPGTGSKLALAAALAEFQKSGAFQTAALRFMHAFLIQVAQTALCNRVHSDEERLARWLLLSQDRIDSDQLPLPRELLAKMLGKNQSGVSVTAAILQSAGLVKYNGAEMAITNREGLEGVTCSCYWVVRRQYNNLLAPGISGPQDPNARLV